MQTKRRALKADLDKKDYNRPKAGGNIKKEQLRVGETVFVHSLGQNAIVQSLPNAKGEIKVQAGILQMNVKLEVFLRLKHRPRRLSILPGRCGAI